VRRRALTRCANSRPSAGLGDFSKAEKTFQKILILMPQEAASGTRSRPDVMDEMKW
jgi:hypothetical protein